MQTYRYLHLKWVYALLRLSFFVWGLSACGGGTGTTDSSSDSSSSAMTSSSSGSSQSSSSSAPLPDPDFNLGLEAYDNLCKNCHDSGDQRGTNTTFGPIVNSEGKLACKLVDCRDEVALMDYIATNMPLGSTADCAEDCALNIAHFIASSFEVNQAEKISSSPQLRLLKREYENTLRVAFDTEVLPGVVLPHDSRKNYVFNDNSVELSSYLPYLEAAEQYAKHFAPIIFPRCDWQNRLNECVRSELAPILSTLYRQNILESDISSIINLMGGITAQGTSYTLALEAAIARALVDQRFLYRMEFGNEVLNEQQKWLSESELKSRLAYLLTDLPPDSTLKNTTGLVNESTAIQQQTARLMNLPEFKEVVWHFISEWLSITAQPGPNPYAHITPLQGDQCNLTAQCRDHFEGVAQVYDCENSQSATSWCSCDGQSCNDVIAESLSLEASMYEETRRFVDHIIGESSTPFYELFTANYSFINKTLADHYGVAAPSEDWVKYTFPESARRQGILTHASFLSSLGKHERDVLWIYRGKTLYERFFCESLPAPPPNAADTVVENRETTQPCSSCHTIVDPMGRIFDAYDDHGLLIEAPLTNGKVELGADIDGNYTDPISFSNMLANSEDVARCITNMWFEFALGRELQAADNASFSTVFQSFVESDTLSGLINAFVVSDAFQTLYVEQTDEACAR